MSNPAYQGSLKIGQSGRDPEGRRKELGSTGVLEEFVLEYRALSEDYESLEREIHRSLAGVRVSPKKEFFTISVPEAINKIREIAGNRIESDKVFYVSPEELERIRIEKLRKRKEAEEYKRKRKEAEEEELQEKLQKEKEKKDAEYYKKVEEANEILRQQNRLHRRILRFFNIDSLYALGTLLYGVFIMVCIAGIAIFIREAL